MNALAGLTFRFGKNHKKAAPAPIVVLPLQPIETPPVEEPILVVESPAPEPVIIPASIPVQAEPIAEQPQIEVRQNAPTPPSPDTYKIRQDIFFAINSSSISAAEKSKLEAVANSLKENPKARVSVVGYADAPTGSSIGNYWLSGWRAVHVRDTLKAMGVSASRIDMNFVGDNPTPMSRIIA